MVARCGGGPHHALMFVLVLSFVLSGHTGEVQQLEDQEPAGEHADCVLGAWGQFSTCSADCGGGKYSRSRPIVTEKVGDGAECGELSDTAACNSQACPVNCVVSAWEAYSTCSLECGGGMMKRSRSIITEPSNNGADCAALEEERECNAQGCRDPAALIAAEAAAQTLSASNQAAHAEAMTELEVKKTSLEKAHVLNLALKAADLESATGLHHADELKEAMEAALAKAQSDAEIASEATMNNQIEKNAAEQQLSKTKLRQTLQAEQLASASKQLSELRIEAAATEDAHRVAAATANELVKKSESLAVTSADKLVNQIVVGH